MAYHPSWGIQYQSHPQEDQEWYYLIQNLEAKGAHNIPSEICPKVNVIARLEFGLAF